MTHLQTTLTYCLFLTTTLMVAGCAGVARDVPRRAAQEPTVTIEHVAEHGFAVHVTNSTAKPILVYLNDESTRGSGGGFNSRVVDGQLQFLLTCATTEDVLGTYSTSFLVNYQILDPGRTLTYEISGFAVEYVRMQGGKERPRFENEVEFLRPFYQWRRIRSARVILEYLEPVTSERLIRRYGDLVEIASHEREEPVELRQRFKVRQIASAPVVLEKSIEVLESE